LDLNRWTHRQTLRKQPFLGVASFYSACFKTAILSWFHLAAGTGNPYVTTDYPSAQRALELRAQALLAAKQGTDGIYTSDPHKEYNSRRYRKINYDTVIQQNLRALDQSAVLLARDHDLPIYVFDFNKVGAMRRFP
jgi:uridylate kinase